MDNAQLSHYYFITKLLLVLSDVMGVDIFSMLTLEKA